MGTSIYKNPNDLQFQPSVCPISFFTLEIIYSSGTSKACALLFFIKLDFMLYMLLLLQ